LERGELSKQPDRKLFYNTKTNNGTMQAINGGTLLINLTTVNNAGRTITADAGNLVDLNPQRFREQNHLQIRDSPVPGLDLGNGGPSGGEAQDVITGGQVGLAESAASPAPANSFSHDVPRLPHSQIREISNWLGERYANVPELA
jgi:hypothetical protein